MTDSLVHLPIEEWSKLQEIFKSDWPRGISAYTALEKQTNWVKEGFDYGFKVFCPFGDMWSGMVAINEKGRSYEIIIQCPTDNTTKLEEALKNTKEIDWKRYVILPFAPSHIIECIKRVVKDIQVNIELILPSESYLMDRQTPLFEDVRIPPSITFEHLTVDHVDLVDSNWPHRYPGSVWYFQLLIKTKSGYGLFKGRNLISWVFINETGPLGHMFTIEEYRRQGYARLLLKLVCNKLLQEGSDVFAFAVKGNKGACELYKQVGFKNFNGVAWCYLKK